MIGYFPSVYAVLSHEVKTRVKGENAVGFSAPVTIAIVEPQPVRENELRLLEPGDRLSNWRVTWTGFAVVPTDRITYKGLAYRVMQVNDRGEFWRVVMREAVPNVA